jgi:hypothetical protein
VLAYNIIKSLSSTKLYSKPLRQAIESKVMTDPQWAYWYARDVIKQRWPEAEPIIRTAPGWAYRYAMDVMKLNHTKAKKWSKGTYRAVK